MLELDLNQFTEAERDTILTVLKRDEDLKQKEQERVRKLRTEVKRLRQKGAIKEGQDASQTCARCRQKFGWFTNKGALCPQCQHRVCDNCRETFEDGEWICVLCYKTIDKELEAMSNQWFYSKFRKSKRNRKTNQVVSGTELVKSSFRNHPPLEGSVSPVAASPRSPVSPDRDVKPAGIDNEHARFGGRPPSPAPPDPHPHASSNEGPPQDGQAGGETNTTNLPHSAVDVPSTSNVVSPSVHTNSVVGADVTTTATSGAVAVAAPHDMNSAGDGDRSSGSKLTLTGGEDVPDSTSTAPSKSSNSNSSSSDIRGKVGALLSKYGLGYTDSDSSPSSDGTEVTCGSGGGGSDHFDTSTNGQQSGGRVRQGDHLDNVHTTTSRVHVHSSSLHAPYEAHRKGKVRVQFNTTGSGDLDLLPSTSDSDSSVSGARDSPWEDLEWDAENLELQAKDTELHREPQTQKKTVESEELEVRDEDDILLMALAKGATELQARDQFRALVPGEEDEEDTLSVISERTEPEEEEVHDEIQDRETPVLADVIRAQTQQMKYQQPEHEEVGDEVTTLDMAVIMGVKAAMMDFEYDDTATEDSLEEAAIEVDLLTRQASIGPGSDTESTLDDHDPKTPDKRQGIIDTMAKAEESFIPTSDLDDDFESILEQNSRFVSEDDLDDIMMDMSEEDKRQEHIHPEKKTKEELRRELKERVERVRLELVHVEPKEVPEPTEEDGLVVDESHTPKVNDLQKMFDKPPKYFTNGSAGTVPNGRRLEPLFNEGEPGENQPDDEKIDAATMAVALAAQERRKSRRNTTEERAVKEQIKKVETTPDKSFPPVDIRKTVEVKPEAVQVITETKPKPNEIVEKMRLMEPERTMEENNNIMQTDELDGREEIENTEHHMVASNERKVKQRVEDQVKETSKTVEGELPQTKKKKVPTATLR